MLKKANKFITLKICTRMCWWIDEYLPIICCRSVLLTYFYMNDMDERIYNHIYDRSFLALWENQALFEILNGRPLATIPNIFIPLLSHFWIVENITFLLGFWKLRKNIRIKFVAYYLQLIRTQKITIVITVKTVGIVILHVLELFICLSHQISYLLFLCLFHIRIS